ncbi:hypothetical protein SAMN05428970_1184 [Agromyces sp. CF514]|uniref:hypothetical protein n=1 Tax=Agromyces sp. CF514 TaxID=1881031 RepID=UPI0008E9FAA2|nr:hypothetical protein [Agromyces sp. CF514]SFR71453.1 hypothetical protein SAMN05428970_1184 [Agromyces sp. CF514]
MNLSDHFWVHELRIADEASFTRDLEHRRIALERTAETASAAARPTSRADAAARVATGAGVRARLAGLVHRLAMRPPGPGGPRPAI